MIGRSLLLFGVLWTVSACTLSREKFSAQPIQHGMTAAELRAAYGDPVEIDRHPNGTQDWYYRFGQQTPARTATSSETAATENTQSYAVSQTTTSTTRIQTAPVHLSPTGRVIRAIPPGRVLISSPGRSR